MFVAVLLFPIGLLALVARKENSSMISVTDVADGPTLVESTGQVSSALREKLQAAFA